MRKSIIAILAMVGIVTFCGWAAYSHQQSVEAVERANAVFGASAGMTNYELENLAQKMTENSEVSIQEARRFEVAMLRTGHATREVMYLGAKNLRPWANTFTGGDVDKASDLMAAALRDPAGFARQIGPRN